MKKLNDKSMGVLIFAYNNEGVDYLKLAIYSANRVIDTWGLPVTIVTDTQFVDDRIDCILIGPPGEHTVRKYLDYDKWMKFLNGNRHLAFHATPYEKTIIIDSDFLVSTTQVIDVWDGKGVKLTRNAYSLDELPLHSSMTHLGRDGLPMFWATVVCFDQSAVSKKFFAYWEKAIRWYKAYANIYGFEPSLIRNDFCVTIALDLLAQKAGSTDAFVLDYAIPTANIQMEVLELDPLKFFTQGTVLEFAKTDVHILNKKPLLNILENNPEDFQCTPQSTRRVA